MVAFREVKNGQTDASAAHRRYQLAKEAMVAGANAYGSGALHFGIGVTTC